MQLFRNDRLHPPQVGRRAFALADADDLVGRGNIAFFFDNPGSQLEATNPNARQMLRFHLKIRGRTVNSSSPTNSVVKHSTNSSPRQVELL